MKSGSFVAMKAKLSSVAASPEQLQSPRCLAADLNENLGMLREDMGEFAGNTSCYASSDEECPNECLSEVSPSDKTGFRSLIYVLFLTSVVVFTALFSSGMVNFFPSSRKTTARKSTPAQASPPPPVRRGSFIVIGDWGWDEKMQGPGKPGCQQAIAEKMLETAQQLGDLKFVINVGDSFYYDGVSSKADPQWDMKWRNVYAPELRAVPWYSVYGNHDLHHDPCICGDGPEDCAQVNWDENDLNFFYMPSLSWYKVHPELGLEVVGLDLNAYASSDHHPGQLGMDECRWTGCYYKCQANVKARSAEGMKLFNSRLSGSAMDNLLVFSHYPTDFFHSFPEPNFLTGLRNASRRIHYFGGHRHNVDNTSTTSIAPNINWLVGGGGGGECDPSGPDGKQNGFVVGLIDADARVTTYPVLVKESLCC